jgi:lysophospholipase L1-like esterase
MKQRTFTAILRGAAVGVAVVILAGCLPQRPEGCRVVFLGDSIAQDIAEQLPASSSVLGYQFLIVNAAVRGGGLIQRPVVPMMYDKIKTGDHVVISIGGNDVIPAAQAIETGTYAPLLREFIATVIDKGGKPVFLGYDVTSNSFFDERQDILINNNVNALLLMVAGEFNIPFISTVGAARYDGVHVNADGIETIITRVWNDGGLSADPACHLK